MSDPFIAQIMQVGFNWAPLGWNLCDGSLQSVQQNVAVYSLVGTTYGGNGNTTFGLPDLRGRMIMGMGTSNYGQTFSNGQQDGAISETITIANLPAHNHPATASGGGASVSALSTTSAARTGTPAAGSILSEVTDLQARGAPQIYAPAGSTGTSVQLGGVQYVAPAVAVGNTGGSQPIKTVSPYTVLTNIFAMQGIYPSRP